MRKSIKQATAFFTGRTTFLAELHERLQSSRFVAITGKSGMGKTTLALEYASRFGAQYQRVCWINVATRELTLLAGIGLMQQLGEPLPPDQPLDAIIPAVRAWLSSHQDYLLILDNANDATFLEALLPPAPTGYTLLITDSTSISPSVTHLEPGRLEPDEGALLLLRRAGLLPVTAPFEQADEDLRASALELAHQLDNLPLALNLVGAFLRETGQGLRAYLTTYHKQLSSSAKGSTHGHTQSLAAICALSLASLEQTRPLAVKIARVCAFLAPDALPLALFIQGATDPRSNLQEIAQNPDALSEACEALCAYGLIEIQATAQTVSMHPLIQAALEGEQHQVRQVFYALHRLMPSNNQEMPAAYHLCYLTHIRRVALLSEQLTVFFREAAEVFSWAALVLYAQKALAEAVFFLQRALAIWENLLGPEHATVTQLQHNLASLYAELENYSEAEDLLHKAIVARARTLGAAHLDTIISLHNLGAIYVKQGKTANAEQTYQKAIALCEHTSSLGNPIAAAIQYDLAAIYLEQEKWELAEPLLQRASVCYEQTLGLEHVETIKVWRDLASTCIGQQKWEQAGSLLERVSSFYERTWGPEHPETIQALQKLAPMYAVQEEWAQAEHLLLRLSTFYARTLGANHLETTNMLHALALVYVSQEKWHEAEPLLQRVLSAHECAPNRSYPEIIACQEQLLFLSLQQGKHAEVKARAQQIQETREAQILAEETDGTVIGLNQLAGIYLAQGRFEEAGQLLRRAMTICERMPELGFSAIAGNLSVLAFSYARQGNQEPATSLLWQALAAWEQALGPEHPDMAFMRAQYREMVDQLNSESVEL